MSGMSQEEFDARSDSGEDVYAIVADDLKRQGYVWDGTRYLSPVEQENNALRHLLSEAVGWAQRPSPIPIVPFQELFARRQRLGWDTWGDEALNHVGILGRAEQETTA